MYGHLDFPGPLDLDLRETDILDQLPAIARLSRALPMQDWDAAWRSLLDTTRQGETRR